MYKFFVHWNHLKGEFVSWIGYQRAILTIIFFVALAFGFLFLFIGDNIINVDHISGICFIIAILAFVITIFIPKRKIEKEYRN